MKIQITYRTEVITATSDTPETVVLTQRFRCSGMEVDGLKTSVYTGGHLRFVVPSRDLISASVEKDDELPKLNPYK